ncbi:MAG: acyl-CoA dehydrogenase family protein [Pseudorhodobacter sp.]|nr:acyl-CoA dehydrogenase family protein [Rhizobacter sp.]
MNAELLEQRSALVATVERFAKTEIAPHATAWDDAGEFPRRLYTQAAEIGLLGLGYPEALGGTPAPWLLRLACAQTISRVGTSGGVLASLFSLNIGLPPVLAHGSAELQQRVIPPSLRGEKIAALAITESGGGSDVARLKTTATRDGNDFIVNGEKTYITSGVRADFLTVAVRTGDAGARGVSLLLVPGEAAGVERHALKKMGWHCSDTAQIRFENVRVSAANLIGEEGAGFKYIMGNFNGERLVMSAAALGFAQACFDEALAWARQRNTFGTPLIERQVIRHKLMDMKMRIASTQAWVDALGERSDVDDSSPDWVAQVCLLKNHATQTMQWCADQAVQILGAMGYMQGTVSERIYREVKVMMIGGGTEEIMKELAARQMGI